MLDFLNEVVEFYKEWSVHQVSVITSAEAHSGLFIPKIEKIAMNSDTIF